MDYITKNVFKQALILWSLNLKPIVVNLRLFDKTEFIVQNISKVYENITIRISEFGWMMRAYYISKIINKVE